MILICGIPNAGKTTYAKRFDNVINFDRVKGTNKQMRERVLEMVKENPSVVVEGVYHKAEDRINLIKASGGGKVIWLDTPTEVCVERELSYRKRPTLLVESCAKHFEPPTFDEGWDEIIIIRGNDEQCYYRQKQD